MSIRNTILSCLLLGSLILLHSQCASTSKASSEQSAEAKEFTAPADKGVVYVFRGGRLYGSGIQYQVKINGQDAGGSGPGTFFRWELKPGRYVVSSSTSESSAAIDLDVKAGELYFVEQLVKVGLSDSRIKLDQVGTSQGKKAVSGSKLLVSTYIPD